MLKKLILSMKSISSLREILTNEDTPKEVKKIAKAIFMKKYIKKYKSNYEVEAYNHLQDNLPGLAIKCMEHSYSYSYYSYDQDKLALKLFKKYVNRMIEKLDEKNLRFYIYLEQHTEKKKTKEIEKMFKESIAEAIKKETEMVKTGTFYEYTLSSIHDVFCEIIFKLPGMQHNQEFKDYREHLNQLAKEANDEFLGYLHRKEILFDALSESNKTNSKLAKVKNISIDEFHSICDNYPNKVKEKHLSVILKKSLSASQLDKIAIFISNNFKDNQTLIELVKENAEEIKRRAKKDKDAKDAAILALSLFAAVNAASSEEESSFLSDAIETGTDIAIGAGISSLTGDLL